MPLLYGTIATTLIGLGLSFLRQRWVLPLILGLLGAILLLIPFHTALDLRLFYLFIGLGLSGLLLASWEPLITGLFDSHA